MNFNMIKMSMTSSNSSRIYLAATMNEELYYNAMQAAFEHGKDAEDIKNIKAYVVPHVSVYFPSIGIAYKITTNDGEQINARTKESATPDEIAEILSRFFAAGAVGLDDDFKASFERQFCKLKERLAA